MKYKTINGWTKEMMKEQIRAMNNGTQSMNDGGQCMYKGLDNNRCAVGCFIPDEFYSPSMEGTNPHKNETTSINGIKINDSLFDIAPELLFLMPLESEGLLDMQMVHDYPYMLTLTNSRDIRDELCAWIDKNVKD